MPKLRRVVGLLSCMGLVLAQLNGGALGQGQRMEAVVIPVQPPEGGEVAPNSVGGFEGDDPVLNDDVMTGVIYRQQGWYLFPQTERVSVRGWLDGGFMGNAGNPGVGPPG